MTCRTMAATALALAVCLNVVGLVEPVSVAAQEAKASATTGPLNLNAASAADLQKLPGVGAAMAARIIEYRQKSGGFKKVEDLMNIQGIGEKNFLKLKPLVSVTPAKVAEK